jgi:hypothetical protein
MAACEEEWGRCLFYADLHVMGDWSIVFISILSPVETFVRQISD